MLKQFLLYFLGALILITSMNCEGCQKTDEPTDVDVNVDVLEKKKTENGFEYVFRIQNDGPKPQIGEYAYYNVEMWGVPESGIPIFFEAGSDFRKVVDPANHKGITERNPLVDILPLLSVGDSVTIFQSPDSIYNLALTYAGVKMFEYNITLTDIGTPVQHNERQIALFNSRKAKLLEARTRLDEINNFCLTTLNDYKANRIENLKETKSGLKYVIHEKGTGPDIRRGNLVNFFYAGLLIDGTFMENTFESGDGTSIQVGREQSFPAWDEALTYLKVGAKVSLFVPYKLIIRKGGGAPPGVPVDSEVMFYMELME